jgi:membrane associated rhomboid family serine protease
VLREGALIPIRDINPRVRVPLVNYALLVSIGLVFLFELSLGRSVEALTREYGFVAVDFQAALDDGRIEVILKSSVTMLTSMFLHGGWFHVIGNVLYLRVFGDNVEDRFGHVPFLLFYLASGAAGALGQFFFDPQGQVPMVGASGAIAGVLGAYVVLFPAARVVTLFPIVIFLTFIEVPAFLFLGIWALQQLLNGYLSIISGQQNAGIAWFAHIGGFSLGIVCGLIARAVQYRRRSPERESDVDVAG